jgi:Nif-specific regulatory protein
MVSQHISPPEAALDESEFKKIGALLEMNTALSSGPTLSAGLQRVLDTLAEHHGAVHSSIVLANGDDSTLRLEGTSGVRGARTPDLGRAAGLLGRVKQTGRLLVVPRTTLEPALQSAAAGARRVPGAPETSLVAVPVLLARKSIGVLAIVLEYKASREFDRSLKFLSLVASMVAQAVKLHHLLAADRQRFANENDSLRQVLGERYEFSNLLGTSAGMRDVLERVGQVARADATVLIRGESGTGKELIAHAIHHASLRARRAFVKVSCAALPESLIESELFGYERGAFTGAGVRKKGRFELAEGGTLFLDEIGELPLGMQVKLLRVLQEREFERLGGVETVKANVRLVTATNRDLEQALASGALREDLFYRLNVFSIFVPPLRQRKADIPLLADHFLLKLAREHRKAVRRISTAAIDALASYHWPGNVREMEHAIGHAVLVCDGGVIHPHHLPPTLQTADASDTAGHVPLEKAVATYEKDLIQDALKSARGNRARAARLLGLTERIIGYKVRKHQIDWRRFRR